MGRHLFRRFVLLLVFTATLIPVPSAFAEDQAPDTLIERLLSDVQFAIKKEKAIRAGDIADVVALVDLRVMPYVNFQRMTASAVGPAWNQASPEQRKQLQEEFKVLLARAYAGTLLQLKDQTISVKPLISTAEDKEVLVRTEIKGNRETVQLDYRLERTLGQGNGWKIYNIKIMGAWLVETYRSQFAQEISTKGIGCLISSLSERNKINAKKI